MIDSFGKLKHESISWLPVIIKSIIIFASFYVLAIVVDKVLTKAVAKNKHLQYNKVIVFSTKFFKRSIIFLGFVMALGNLDFDISALLAGIGITGFALGFALKEVLSNAVSSVIIMLYTPFEIGDYIKICDSEGEVSKIDIHYTTLVQGNKLHLIPNAKLISERMTIVKKD